MRTQGRLHVSGIGSSHEAVEHAVNMVEAMSPVPGSGHCRGAYANLAAPHSCRVNRRWVMGGRENGPPASCLVRTGLDNTDASRGPKAANRKVHRMPIRAVSDRKRWMGMSDRSVAEAPSNKRMQLTRSAMARNRGPRS
jgi:hypothetical protein